MANGYNYSSDKHDIILTIKGIPYPLSDFGDDVKIKIAYEEDFATTTTGTDGDYTISEMHNNHALIDLKILQESPLNAIMTISAKDREEFTIAHVDRNFNGDVGHFASSAYFVKIPDLEVGATSGSRTWQVRAHNLKPNFAL